MKIYQLFPFFLVLALVSCNGPDKTSSDTVNKTVAGTSSVDISQDLLGKFKTFNTIPYTADTVLMFHLEACDSLGTKEVKQLDGNWFVIDSSRSEDYILKDFYFIDSVKASGNYAAWCDSLQPGMTMRSNAYALGKIAVDSSSQLIVWGLSTSSYEACPFTTMQNVYVSLMHEALVARTFKLAEYISSADPPVAMERIITGTINKDLTVDLNLYEEGDEDMDLPELNVTRGAYRLAIKGDRITLLSEKKEEPVKVKRKK